MMNKKGFTLVELILVLAVTTILLGTIVTIFLQSIDMYKTDETKASNQSSLNIISTKMDSSLRSATDVYYDADGCHVVKASGEDLYYHNTTDKTISLNGSPLAGRIASFSCLNPDGSVTITIQTINDSKGNPSIFETTIVLRRGE